MSIPVVSKTYESKKYIAMKDYDGDVEIYRPIDNDRFEFPMRVGGSYDETWPNNYHCGLSDILYRNKDYSVKYYGSLPSAERVRKDFF